MRVYPSEKRKKSELIDGKPLTSTDRVTEFIALLAAGVTAYYFFIKILFL